MDILTLAAGLTLALCVCPLKAESFTKSAPALRPYMGWSSWSFLRGGPSESRIKAQARVLAARLKRYGYDYVNIDAGWTKEFDRYGRPVPNPKYYPDGMSGLAAWLHQRGLKLGIYLVPGLNPKVYAADCRILGTPYTVRQIVRAHGSGNTSNRGYLSINYNKPGTMAYIQSDADMFARWGVDFIKMDFVGSGGHPGWLRNADNRPDIAAWAAALKHTGRPIWLELSNNLSIKYADFWRTYANGSRDDHDIDAYRTPYLTDWARVYSRFVDTPKWARYAEPGGWNDLDSIEIGNDLRDGLTPDERQSVMTLWCISCSPLYLGTDLTHLTAADFKIITNRQAIAIDQAGHPATPISQATPQQVWRVKNPGNRSRAKVAKSIK